MSTRPSPVIHPRGQLPPRVYWIRRSLVAITALVLVFGFAHLLGNLGGGSKPNSQGARLAAHSSSHKTTALLVPHGTAVTSKKGTLGASSTPTPTPSLAQPSGPCKAQDLSVSPVVSSAHAVNPVTIKLELSGSSPACTFAVSPKTLAVKVVSGTDRIWSSQDCPGSITKDTVVVRSGAETAVPVKWSGRRSNGTCSAANSWAQPGYYHALAAVIGSTPADTQFKLTVAPRAVITKTAKPHPHHVKSTSPTAPAQHSTGSKKSTGSKGTGTSCGGDNAAGTC